MASPGTKQKKGPRARPQHHANDTWGNAWRRLRSIGAIFAAGYFQALVYYPHFSDNTSHKPVEKITGPVLVVNWTKVLSAKHFLGSKRRLSEVS